jgi:hypothetical protein
MIPGEFNSSRQRSEDRRQFQQAPSVAAPRNDYLAILCKLTSLKLTPLMPDLTRFLSDLAEGSTATLHHTFAPITAMIKRRDRIGLSVSTIGRLLLPLALRARQTRPLRRSRSLRRQAHGERFTRTHRTPSFRNNLSVCEPLQVHDAFLQFVLQLRKQFSSG